MKLVLIATLALLAQFGCAKVHTGEPDSPSGVHEVRATAASDDSLIAERAAVKFDKDMDALYPGWTHDEKVGFFLRALHAPESRTYLLKNL